MFKNAFFCIRNNDCCITLFQAPLSYVHLYDGILKEKLRRLNQFIPPILTTDEMLQLADQNSQDNDIYTVAELVSGLFCFLNLLELSLFEFQRLLWNHYNCLSLRTQNIQDFLSIIVKNFFFFSDQISAREWCTSSL